MPVESTSRSSRTGLDNSGDGATDTMRIGDAIRRTASDSRVGGNDGQAGLVAQQSSGEHSGLGSTREQLTGSSPAPLRSFDGHQVGSLIQDQNAAYTTYNPNSPSIQPQGGESSRSWGTGQHRRAVMGFVKNVPRRLNFVEQYRTVKAMAHVAEGSNYLFLSDKIKQLKTSKLHSNINSTKPSITIGTLTIDSLGVGDLQNQRRFVNKILSAFDEEIAVELAKPPENQDHNFVSALHHIFDNPNGVLLIIRPQADIGSAILCSNPHGPGNLLKLPANQEIEPGFLACMLANRNFVFTEKVSEQVDIGQLAHDEYLIESRSSNIADFVKARLNLQDLEFEVTLKSNPHVSQVKIGSFRIATNVDGLSQPKFLVEALKQLEVDIRQLRIPKTVIQNVFAHPSGDAILLYCNPSDGDFYHRGTTSLIDISVGSNGKLNPHQISRILMRGAISSVVPPSYSLPIGYPSIREQDKNPASQIAKLVDSINKKTKNKTVDYIKVEDEENAFALRVGAIGLARATSLGSETRPYWPEKDLDGDLIPVLRFLQTIDKLCFKSEEFRQRLNDLEDISTGIINLCPDDNGTVHSDRTMAMPIVDLKSKSILKHPSGAEFPEAPSWVERKIYQVNVYNAIMLLSQLNDEPTNTSVGIPT